MKISRYILVPLVSVSLAGGAVAFIFDHAMSPSATLRSGPAAEAGLQPQPEVPRQDSNSDENVTSPTLKTPIVSEGEASAPVESLAVETSLHQEDVRHSVAPGTAQPSSPIEAGRPEQSLAVRQKGESALSVISPRVSAPTQVSPNVHHGNSPPVIAVAASQQNSETEGAPPAQTSASGSTGNNTAVSVDSGQVAPISNRAYRGSPLTPDEELYRLWHGWGSIDAFRDAQAAQGH